MCKEYAIFVLTNCESNLFAYRIEFKQKRSSRASASIEAKGSLTECQRSIKDCFPYLSQTIYCKSFWGFCRSESSVNQRDSRRIEAPRPEGLLAQFRVQLYLKHGNERMFARPPSPPHLPSQYPSFAAQSFFPDNKGATCGRSTHEEEL